MSVLKRMLVFPVRWYQLTISSTTDRQCRYQPTCSAYAIEAIEAHGVIKGTMLASWRLLRCNPWSKGGVDWVPPQGAWPTSPMNYEQLMEYRQQHEQGSSDASPDHCDPGGVA